MGFINIFHRVDPAKLENEILPAFQRALDAVSIEPLLPHLDVARLGRQPRIEMRTVGVLRKKRVAVFDPSPGELLGATLNDDYCDVDKFLRPLYGNPLLADNEWAELDQLLNWGHNLPALFHGYEGPYGYVNRDELPRLIELARRLAVDDDLGVVERLCKYLSTCDAVMVYTG
jgi:hypothetical protein